MKKGKVPLGMAVDLVGDAATTAALGGDGGGGASAAAAVPPPDASVGSLAGCGIIDFAEERDEQPATCGEAATASATSLPLSEAEVRSRVVGMAPEELLNLARHLGWQGKDKGKGVRKKLVDFCVAWRPGACSAG